MIWGGFNPGFNFNTPHFGETEPTSKINPFRVVLNIFDTPEWSRKLLPPRDPAVQLCKIDLKILFKDLLMLRKIARKTGSDVLCRDLPGERIQEIVRIPFRVQVSFGAVQTRRRFENGDAHRAIYVAWLPRINFRITDHYKKTREPRILIIQTCQDEYIGSV